MTYLKTTIFASHSNRFEAACANVKNVLTAEEKAQIPVTLKFLEGGWKVRNEKDYGKDSKQMQKFLVLECIEDDISCRRCESPAAPCQ